MEGKQLRSRLIKSTIHPNDMKIGNSLYHVKDGPKKQEHKLFYNGQVIDSRRSNVDCLHATSN